MAGNIPQCDLYFPSVVKFTADGEIDWSTWYPGLLFYTPVEVSQLSDSSFIVAASQFLFRIESSGNLLWSLTYDLSINDIVVHPDNIIYTASSDGFRGVDLNGNELFTNGNYPFETLRIHPSSGHIAGSQNDNLSVLDANLDLVESFDFGEPVQDFFVDSQYIAVLLGPTAGTGEQQVVLIDFSNFSIISQFFLQEDNLIYDLLALAGEEIILAGRDIYTTPNTAAALVKSFTFDGNTIDYGMDASLAGVQLSVAGWEDALTVKSITFSDVLIHVKNEGADTLHSVVIALELPGFNGGICTLYPQYISRSFDGLELPPGESVEIDFGNFKAFFPWQADTAELCFYTFLPNNRIDHDHNNDISCTSAIVVSSNEKQRPPLTITLSPNPVVDELRLDLEDLLSASAHLAIFNYLGQTMMEADVIKKEIQTKLDISHLPAGVYFLEFRMGEYECSQKFLKM